MSSPTPRIRLDQLLTNTGLASSRSRARDMIGRKCVTVDGKLMSKAGALVDPNAKIEIDDPAQTYVSRAALKLIAALDATGFSVEGKLAVDLGASTGGFTQVLLERGAKHVVSVDVGHGQLIPSLSEDPRVTSLENQNARALTIAELGAPPDIIVSDMSFVSLTIAAEPALKLASDNAKAMLLLKPQFEVGKDGVGKGGIVTDTTLIDETVERLKGWFNGLPGWRVTHVLPSPIKGGDGNLEFLLCGVRSDRT